MSNLRILSIITPSTSNNFISNTEPQEKKEKPPTTIDRSKPTPSIEIKRAEKPTQTSPKIVSSVEIKISPDYLESLHKSNKHIHDEDECSIGADGILLSEFKIIEDYVNSPTLKRPM